MGHTYKVTYRYAGNGVIAYDYVRSDFDSQTLKKYVGTALVVVAVGVFVGVTFGAGAGVGLAVGGLVLV